MTVRLRRLRVGQRERGVRSPAWRHGDL